jgi:hypothetical protein
MEGPIFLGENRPFREIGDSHKRWDLRGLMRMSLTEWLDIRDSAWDAGRDGKFVAIPGPEWTKKTRHMNIFSLRQYLLE